MNFVFEAHAPAAMGTAAALAIFSIAVGWLGRFRGPSRWYAVFGAGFGVAIIVEFIVNAYVAGHGQGLPPSSALRGILVMHAVESTFRVVWLYGVIRLVDEYGGRPFRWVLWVGAALSAALWVDTAWFVAGLDELPLYYRVPRATLFLIDRAPIGAMAFAPIALGLARRVRWQSGQAILAAALPAYPFALGAARSVLLAMEDLSDLWYAAFTLVAYLALVVVWTALQRTPSRAGLAVAGIASFLVLVGFFVGLYGNPRYLSTFARSFDILLVAYAILRLQYLGLDLKVRWTISKSTVAAAFVTVFFIASEAASQFFGERFNNNYIGIAAAGILVFGIAPLQRLGDRLAATAVPVAQTQSKSEAAYMAALRAAVVDRVITRREERHLAELADHLELGAARALELREQVETESRA